VIFTHYKCFIIKIDNINPYHNKLRLYLNLQMDLQKMLIDCHDNMDPISMTLFWVEDNNQTRTLVYPVEEIDRNLVFYKDSSDRIRCFEKETLQYLSSYNIKDHPVTGEPLPDSLFDGIIKIDIKKEDKTIEEKAMDTFQYLTNFSIFIDYNLFLKLNKNQLSIFHKELKDFWLQNFTPDQKAKITSERLFDCENNFFIKSTSKLPAVQSYVLHNINLLLQCDNMELKHMICYIIMGALGLVIPEIKEMYPDFAFEF
jgi:hypothetical protein